MTTAARHALVKELAFAAVELSAAARALFLAGLRSQDGALAGEVESLLRYHEPGWLDAPAALPGLHDLPTIAGERSAPAMVAEPLAPAPAPRAVSPAGTAAPPEADAGTTAALLVGARATFEPLRRLGGGAFGSVFLARRVGGDPSLPEEVAVKRFDVAGAHGSANLLKRELAALSALQCDRVPPVLDWAVEPEPFLAVPFYPAGDLNGHVREHGPLPLAAAWRLLEDLAAALVAAHRAGLLHLDIKPHNVLLDGRGGFVLTDFGASQATLVRQMTAVTVGMGTPGYQAPEQVRFDPGVLDARTDLFGAGITVWQALTGERPALLAAPASPTEPVRFLLPPLAALRRDVDPRLAAIVAALCAASPAARPGGAAEVLAWVRSAAPPALSEVADEAAPLPPGQLIDPLWEAIERREGIGRLVRFAAGETICREGEDEHDAFVLLAGHVDVERGGARLAREVRQGTFLGEVSALAGTPRTATVRAATECVCGAFNAAELERFLVSYPDLALRLLKAMAERVVRESAAAAGGARR